MGMATYYPGSTDTSCGPCPVFNVYSPRPSETTGGTWAVQTTTRQTIGIQFKYQCQKTGAGFTASSTVLNP